MNASRLTPAEKLLRLFTDVRPGEGVGALLLALNLFLILAAYQLLKVTREPLILGAPGGAEVKSYAAAGQALLLLGAVPLYGALASRLARRRLITVVTVFFALCLAGFFLLGRAGVALGIPFYLWLGIFNMMIVAQLWAFANDVYTTDEGQRLFPIVGFGASLGAVAGPWIAGRVFDPKHYDPGAPYWLMLAAAGILVASLGVTALVDARERRRSEGHLPPPDTTAEMPAATTLEMRVATTAEMRAATGEAQPISRDGPFAMVFRTRYLLLIAGMILVLNWVNTTGEYIVSRTVTDVADRTFEAAGLTVEDHRRQFAGQFYAGYNLTVNAVALLLQLFVVSRVFKYLGVRVAVLVLPCIALGGYALLAVVPVLGIIRWVKVAENSTDYSLQNTVRGALFLPTTRDQKYKAKQAIDSFFVRGGDLLSAGLVALGAAVHAGPRHFAAFNLVLVAAWLWLARKVGREYEALRAGKAE